MPLSQTERIVITTNTHTHTHTHTYCPSISDPYTVLTLNYWCVYSGSLYASMTVNLFSFESSVGAWPCVIPYVRCLAVLHTEYKSSGVSLNLAGFVSMAISHVIRFRELMYNMPLKGGARVLIEMDWVRVVGREIRWQRERVKERDVHILSLKLSQILQYCILFYQMCFPKDKREETFCDKWILKIHKTKLPCRVLFKNSSLVKPKYIFFPPDTQ